jgi:O-antigen ligase
VKKVFCINDSIENKISYFHLLFFLLALPFDRIYSTVVLESYLIHTIIFLSKRGLKNISRTTFILQSVFFVTVISTIYGPSISDSLNVTTRQLALFIFPFLFTVTSLDLAKYRSRLLLGLTLSCTFTVIYLYCDAIHVLIYNKLPLRELFSWAFVNHNFSLPIDMHATYLSMLLVISIIYSLQQFFKDRVRSKNLYYIICSIILFAGLIQLSSKSALSAILITITIGFSWILVRRENRYKFLFISSVVSVLLVACILSFQVFRERYLTTLKEDLYGNKGLVKMNGRIDRWNIAFNLIRQSPVLGTGSGSEVPLLRNSYFEQKMYGPYLLSLNAHNQYLSFTINSGIIGLIVYLSTLCWGFWHSFKNRDILFFSFIVLITIVSLSEDVLDVNKGIFFYSFFFSFLFYSGRKSVT